MRYFVLFVIDLKIRRVEIAGIVLSPTLVDRTAWLMISGGNRYP